MKKILGLDLGTNSIGWAVIAETEESRKIEALGSRIVPLSIDDANEFTQGNAISKNASRTARRTQRKGYDRYQQRRNNLVAFLREHEMSPVESYDKLGLWGLRADAVERCLSLPEIGRVLLHINQKRGYKATKADYDASDKTKSAYKDAVMGRHREIVERGVTVGQFFFEKLSADPAYRTKEQVFPRRAYEEEFDKIVECQREYHPQVFTDANIDKLRNEIIFYQRGLKSCKHLVSVCEFEKREYNGKMSGPKVAPRSSPLSQVCKMWESINNLTLKNRSGEEYPVSIDERRAMFDHLDNNDKLTLTDLYRILGVSKSDGWWGGKAIGKGLQGNVTKMALRKALGDGHKDLLRFDLSRAETADKQTGEVLEVVSDKFLDEPLYRLWHLTYSLGERTELEQALEKQFGITDPHTVDNLYKLDFVKAGYANKSAKAMRRILPWLELGRVYSDACEAAGFRHSESLSVAENKARELLSELPRIEKNELRQPVVEKILNQMINIVNALMERHGQFDEIRVELARELKQSKDERNETTKKINKAERENKIIAERIEREYRLTPTRSRIQKYKMWEEAEHTCFYCGQPVGAAEFLNGYDVEVEHVIPRSLFFDDGFSNKVCACRKCNKEKNNRTAYDYMRSKPEGEFNLYLERIEKLYKNNKISKTKYDRLLTPSDKIPTDFIDRQLRESQYIARKSREILSSVCHDVTSTSGSVTAFLRENWGYNKVLHSLNFDRHKSAGLTQTKERSHRGNSWNEEVIRDWSKRLDHRHHAIDALVVASTKQGYIQRINNMNAQKTADGKLENYIQQQPHFSTAEVEHAIDSVLVSFKAGKRAVSTGKRYVHRGGRRILAQDNIIIPRGALHEESLYGSIEHGGKTRSVLKYPLSSIVRKDVGSIVDRGIRKLIEERFASHTGNEKNIWDKPLLFNGIPVRSVRCFTGLKPEATTTLGRGTVKLGNNHHIAIYVDRDGKHHESCVTFWQAVERKKHRIPIVITRPDEIDYDSLPDTFSETLPPPDWSFEVSLGQNEMFVLGLEPEAFEEALRMKDHALLSKYLYRVQSVSERTYWFRLHTETVNDKTPEAKIAMKYYLFKSVGAFLNAHPQKVRISLLGEISKA
jgi:CRISPR-associated endonuclease Csn1